MTEEKLQKIALVGIGKIARDQHIPSIERNSSLILAATVSQSTTVEGIDNFNSLDELFVNRKDIQTVALCTPPHVRFQLAWDALNAGKNVLLEKPPGATLSEVETLVRLAESKGLTLYATWHSRHAAGVEAAKEWLANRAIRKVRIVWKEDVRRWHPNQSWIWDAGNMGVFDPAINALSILTRIMPHELHVSSADLEFPANCETPIAANLIFKDPFGGDIKAEFDWRHEGHQTWDIRIETEDGNLLLSEGGSKLRINDQSKIEDADHEYDAIYAHFAELLMSNKIDVDVGPLRHVADAFMIGRRHITDEFHE